MTPPKAPADCPIVDDSGGYPAQRRKWSIDKSVNVPTVLTIITMIFAALTYVMQQDQRQTRIETRVDNHDHQLKDLKGDLKDDLARVERKLDRLIDSRNEIPERPR